MGKKYFVQENLDEFAKRGRGRPKKVTSEEGDDWYKGDDEFDAPEAGPEQIEDVEIEDEVADAAVMKKVTRMLDNELGLPEFSRGVLRFKIRNSGEIVNGTPMAKMGGGAAYLFKTPGGMKKVKVEDILVESEEPRKFVSESFNDYE